MKLIFTLPNGEKLDLLDNGPNGMEYICDCSRQFEHHLTDLIDAYKEEPDSQRRLKIADEIRDQAYYFAGETANYDEDLQQMINWDELAEQMYQALITFARI